MIRFRSELQSYILSKLTTEVGPTSSVNPSVKLFDTYLHDVQHDQVPYLVVTVRTAEKAEPSEIGSPYDLYKWTVHLYYLDITSTFPEGDDKRNYIMSLVEKFLEEDRRLGNLEVVDSAGNREYVYDSEITAILFDSSGQENYYSFVSELYLDVHTART